MRPAGPLDRWGCVRLRFRILGRIAKGCKKLLLDLKRVPYVDSDGVRLLKWLREEWSDTAIELTNANRSVCRTLSLSHLDGVLSVSRPAHRRRMPALKAG